MSRLRNCHSRRACSDSAVLWSTPSLFQSFSPGPRRSCQPRQCRTCQSRQCRRRHHATAETWQTRAHGHVLHQLWPRVFLQSLVYLALESKTCTIERDKSWRPLVCWFRQKSQAVAESQAKQKTKSDVWPRPKYF